MEPLSRVRKNAELRQEIENSRESELTSSVLTSYANRLNRINPELSSVETATKLEDYAPHHSKKETELSLGLHQQDSDPAFYHDMLDEFIDEVKSYNIKKGYSAHEDTDLNILKTITQVPRSTEREPEQDDDQITQEIKRVISTDFDKENDESKEFGSQKLTTVFEETAEIKLKLESVDKELLEMSQSVNHSSKTLNVIAFILVLVLLGLLGIAFYWIFWTQGI